MVSTAAVAACGPAELMPAGVGLTSLTTHVDERGDFTEFFRQEWHQSPEPVQWSVSRSAPNVLRGVNVHALHWDYFCVVAGEMTVGLHDMRPESPHARRSVMLQLTSERLQMLTIPPGVAHGFYTAAGSMHISGSSTYYYPLDHPRCRWDRPELGLDWPCSSPRMSAADRTAMDYPEFRAAYLAMAATQQPRA